MVARQSRTGSRTNGGVAARSTEMIGDYPAASMVVLFGVGLGVGLVVGHAIAESVTHEPARHDSLVHKLTCQIRHALKQALPESVWQQLS